ncbi:MAG: ABC transporter ATP-binding protein [Actinomycetaceae bacterium]|nr:ABC transporter ATP-binding protein [Actinomycetaceae bacterium]
MNNAISIRDVSKSFKVYRERNQSLKAAILSGKRAKYDEFWALRDVSFDIPEGKTFGLLGRNGSGKSTLLKCIARILTPNSGTITARGRMAAMLEVGSGFHPELSGRENIVLNGTILGMTEKEIARKFDEIVDFSGIGDFIDQPVKNYSSGMYVRLGFSVSIHVEPDILLVDEVLAVGDMDFQDKCMAKFVELKSQGKTVVVVSHGLEQMRTFCDEAVWLDHGEPKAMGRASDVIDSFADDTRQARPVEGGGTRFGSGEIEVTKVEVLDEAGRPTTVTRTGDRRSIRVHYTCREEVVEPVFGVNIDVMGGPWIWGWNGLDGGFVPERMKPGSGSFDVHVPWVPLRPGAYTISTSVQGPGGNPDYDIYGRACDFSISSGPYQESAGYVSMNASFGGFEPARA